jgi:hypothetical protein
MLYYYDGESNDQYIIMLQLQTKYYLLLKSNMQKLTCKNCKLKSLKCMSFWEIGINETEAILLLNNVNEKKSILFIFNTLLPKCIVLPQLIIVIRKYAILL